MPKLRTSKNSNTATKLRRAVAMLEPKLDLDTLLALSDAEVADIILHYALHVDAQRHVRPEPNNEDEEGDWRFPWGIGDAESGD